MLLHRSAEFEPAQGGTAEPFRRIIALDGLRGVACLMVLISHFFAEVPHGVTALAFGWVGVDIFFVLSGFLIGTLILDKGGQSNFFAVFYARRFWRIIPAYLLTVLAVVFLLNILPGRWSESSNSFPIWAYLSFLQGAWMTSSHTIGAHWLAPTWTLAVEEHFYLVAPALIIFVPRRRLVTVLALVAISALAFRAMVFGAGPAGPMAGLVLLPGRADQLALGILAALLFRFPRDRRWTMSALRTSGLAALLVTIGLSAWQNAMMYVLGPTIMGIGCAGTILALARGAPEAVRLRSSVLRFFGDNAYCIYLIHLPVLGILHGILLGTSPDLEHPAQWAVTILAIPITIALGRLMTWSIEEPLTALGRKWKWSGEIAAGRNPSHEPTSPVSLPPLLS